MALDLTGGDHEFFAWQPIGDEIIHVIGSDLINGAGLVMNSDNTVTEIRIHEILDVQDMLRESIIR